MYEIAAQVRGVPFINLKEIPIRKDILFTIPEPIAQTHQVICFDADENSIKVATINPNNLQLIDFLQKRLIKN